jgi:hypothetical protein
MSDTIFDSLLNKTATILRPTQNTTPNSFGEKENTASPTTIATVAVCVQPNKEKYEIDIGGLKYWVELVAYLNPVDVRTNDRLLIDSIHYLVVGVEDEAGQVHHLKLYIVKQ